MWFKGICGKAFRQHDGLEYIREAFTFSSVDVSSTLTFIF